VKKRTRKKRQPKNWATEKIGNENKRVEKQGNTKLPSHFSLPNSPLAQFSVAHFSGCRFFPLPYLVFIISDNNFGVAFFPTISIFVAEFSRYPIFRCPFSRCRFSVVFSVAVISNINFVLPFCLPSNFSFSIFPVAQFSGFRFFRCRFSCPFYRCRFYLLPRVVFATAAPRYSEHESLAYKCRFY